MFERRKSVRSRTFLGGMIAFNKRTSTMDCRVRDFHQRARALISPTPPLSRIAST